MARRAQSVRARGGPYANVLAGGAQAVAAAAVTCRAWETAARTMLGS